MEFPARSRYACAQLLHIWGWTGFPDIPHVRLTHQWLWVEGGLCYARATCVLQAVLSGAPGRGEVQYSLQAPLINHLSTYRGGMARSYPSYKRTQKRPLTTRCLICSHFKSWLLFSKILLKCLPKLLLLLVLVQVSMISNWLWCSLVNAKF